MNIESSISMTDIDERLGNKHQAQYLQLGQSINNVLNTHEVKLINEYCLLRLLGGSESSGSLLIHFCTRGLAKKKYETSEITKLKHFNS